MLYTFAVLFVGLLLLIIAAVFHKTTGRLKIFVDVLRDVGIALIVAVVVTGVFELYARTQEQAVSLEKEIDKRMGDQLTPEVWQDVKRQVLDKHLLRRNGEIRLQFDQDRDLRTDQARMTLEFSYDLYNISDPRTEFTIQHELDYPHFPSKHLPRFERATIETQEGITALGQTQLDAASRAGVINMHVKLTKGSDLHARVVTRRSELINIPGSYNLYMNEYAKGVRVRLDRKEPNTRIEVKVRPEGSGRVLHPVGDEWVFDNLILPGQAVELRFEFASPRQAAN